MTQEEKARAYDEALEKARALRQEAIDKEYAIDYVKDYEAIFPELAESEDERIRKSLLAYIKGESKRLDTQKWIAYLEKQKEQKPAGWIEDSVKFEEGFKAGRESGLRDGQKYVLTNLDSYGLCKSAEWSEKDLQHKDWIEKLSHTEIDNARGIGFTTSVDSIIDKLNEVIDVLNQLIKEGKK